MPPKTGRSKSPTTPKTKTPTGKTSRSRSPHRSSSSIGGNHIDQAVIDLLMKAKMDDDESDYKTIKIPLFSDGTEWEEVVFELEVNLERIWNTNLNYISSTILMALSFPATRNTLLRQIK